MKYVSSHKFCTVTLQWGSVYWDSSPLLEGRGVQMFQKPRNHRKIQGAWRVTRTKFHTRDPQILRATVETLVACTTWRQGFVHPCYRDVGYAVAQLVESLLYKIKGLGFDSRWESLRFSTYLIFPVLESTQSLTEMSTWNLIWGGGGKGGRCAGLTTLPPSCADCLRNSGRLTDLEP
jgi:hypothetical protein